MTAENNAPQEPRRTETEEEKHRRQRKNAQKAAKKNEFHGMSLDNIWKYARTHYESWKGLSWDEFHDRWSALNQHQKENALRTIHLLMFLDRGENRFHRNKSIEIEQIESDARAKSSSEFREYTLATAQALEEMVRRKIISDWQYVAQNRKTQLDASVDASGIDWIIQVPDFIWKTYVLIQQATSLENKDEKTRELQRRYPNMNEQNLIGIVAARKGYAREGAQAADLETLISRIQEEISETVHFRMGNIFIPKFPK